MSDRLLKRLRHRLRLIDRDIVHDLERRMRIVKVIARYKTHQSLPIYQPERERRVLEVIKRLPLENIPRQELLDLFQRIMRMAREVEMGTVRREIIRRQRTGTAGHRIPPVPFKSILVVGMGVIGGSLVKALRSQCPGLRLYGVDVDTRVLDAATGFVDESASSVEPFLERSDLIILCIPIGEILSWLDTWGPRIRRAVVMDVGSVKSVIMERATKTVPSTFVGGHPLCGSEQSGFHASDPLMFFHRPFFLSRHDGTSDAIASKIESFVQIIGAKPHWIDPVVHDQRMAYSSHLPQLLVTALAAFIHSNPDFDWHEHPAYSGTGLRSTLRLAGSAFTIWRDILTYNPFIQDILHAFRRFLDAVPEPGQWDHEFLYANEVYRILYKAMPTISLMPESDTPVEKSHHQH